MGDVKRLHRMDQLADETHRLIDLETVSHFQGFVRERYTAELMESVTRHIRGGWNIDDCSLVYLHWLVEYPNEKHYDTNHGFPQAGFGAVVRRIMHLSRGWEEGLIRLPDSSERASEAFDLPDDLVEFSDCTLFGDGVEYGRTRRGVTTAHDSKYWYAKKLRGPGWRVVVQHLLQPLESPKISARSPHCPLQYHFR